MAGGKDHWKMKLLGLRCRAGSIYAFNENGLAQAVALAGFEGRVKAHPVVPDAEFEPLGPDLDGHTDLFGGGMLAHVRQRLLQDAQELHGCCSRYGRCSLLTIHFLPLNSSWTGRNRETPMS